MGENAGTVIEGEVEEQAKRMGWVPQEDFRGADDRWVPADKFLERGQNELPIMRERMKKMDGTIKGLNNKISGMNETFGEFQQHQQGVADRAYAKALKDIEAKKQDAVERNDVEGYNAAKKEGDELEPEAAPEVKKSDPKEVAAEKEFMDWKEKNEWYDDPQLQKYASDISGAVQDQTGLGGTKLYDKVRDQVAAMYPDKFENINRSSPQTVVGDSGNPPPVGKRSFATLPKDAQVQCRRFVKEISGFTKEQYVKDYDWD